MIVNDKRVIKLGEDVSAYAMIFNALVFVFELAGDKKLERSDTNMSVPLSC